MLSSMAGKAFPIAGSAGAQLLPLPPDSTAMAGGEWGDRSTGLLLLLEIPQQDGALTVLARMWLQTFPL